MKWLTIITWLALCVPAWAATPASVKPSSVTPSSVTPSSVKLSYEVFSNGLKIGQIDEVYSRNKDRYTLTSTTTPLGLLAVFKPQKVFVRSSGLINKQGLRPLRFEYQREGDASRSVSAEFDWSAQQLTLINPAIRTPLKLPNGTQDRLSAMYQFMFLTLNKPSRLDFPMTNGSKLDDYHYASGSRQKIDTPAGQCDGLYLDSQAKPGETRTELWLSSQHYNLPCKMIITDGKGEKLTQILSSAKIVP